jgi:glycosyltransferase involved in cell wall biosynthesis
MLQATGLIVHFLYYQMEGLTPRQLSDMEECWDYVHLVPCAPRTMAATGPGYYMLDDWADPLVSETATKLHDRFHFCAVITNYVWFSDVLQAFGPDVVKIIDTHDVFGARDQRFRDAGLNPEWFFTTHAEEARGLARADIVLAIQDEEAKYFQELGHPDVRVLGHKLGRRHRRMRRAADQPRVIGYLASGNPLNTSSFDAMRRRLVSLPTRANLSLVVAGAICDKLGADVRPFKKIGRVEHLDDFYDKVDIVVNPMAVGTGLKIKSVEALFAGLPLIATTAAMNGLPCFHPMHALAGPEEVAERLASETFSDECVGELMSASMRSARVYAQTVSTAVQGLHYAIFR